MIGGNPIAWSEIAGDGDEVVYLPVSRISSGGTFRRPASVPETPEGIHFDDGTIIEWDDDTPIFWD